MSAFGDALTRLMTARGLGVHELARMSHYSPGHISNLRSGAKKASPQCAAELGDLLNDGGELTALAGNADTEPEREIAEQTPRAVFPRTLAAADDVSPIEHLRVPQSAL